MYLNQRHVMPLSASIVSTFKKEMQTYALTNGYTMRPGQQHRRGGGRPPNALSQHYESNGPDVKLRGTAAQIAQKYLSLARDALVSGDMVTAESYFQHAEHYNRIIMAAQSQLGVPNSHQSAGHNGGGGFRPRNAGVSDRFMSAGPKRPSKGSDDG